MNITQVLQNLGEDRANFIEALADASHYLGNALDLLDRNDQVTLRALVDARNAIDDLLVDLSDDDDESDESDDDVDFSGIEKAIADEGKEMTISQMLKDQWANEKLVGRGWH